MASIAEIRRLHSIDRDGGLPRSSMSVMAIYHQKTEGAVSGLPTVRK